MIIILTLQIAWYFALSEEPKIFEALLRENIFFFFFSKLHIQYTSLVSVKCGPNTVPGPGDLALTDETGIF